MTNEQKLRDALFRIGAALSKFNQHYVAGIETPSVHDYDRVLDYIGCALTEASAIPEPNLGRLWWVSDDADDFANDMARLTPKGARLVRASYDIAVSPAVHYIIELDKDRAEEILGYEPGTEEWLED